MPQVVQLQNELVTFGIGWDLVQGHELDLDVACFMYDGGGNLLDVIYFNNLVSMDGSIHHSGDNRDGFGEGDDEQIKLDLPRIDSEVKVLLFPIVVQNEDASFQWVQTGHCRIFHPHADVRRERNITQFNLSLAGQNYPSYIVAMIARDPADLQKWNMTQLHRPSTGRGLDNLDVDLNACLEYAIPRDVLNKRGFSLSKVNKLDLKKGDEFVLSSTNGELRFGLGWDTGCDLDAWCFLVNNELQCVDQVGFSHLQSNCKSVKHHGDNLTGEGEGDDEVISVWLDKVPPQIKYLFFAVKVYTAGKTFSQVRNPFVRMVDVNKRKVIAKFMVKDIAGNDTGMMFCKVFRMGPRWRFQAIGQGIDKNHLTKSKNDAWKKFALVQHGPPQSQRGGHGGSHSSHSSHSTSSHHSGDSHSSQSSQFRKMKVTLVSGRNLIACDKGGTSDPYCVLEIWEGSRQLRSFKSKKIKKTLNPVWSQSVTVTIHSDNLSVRGEVWDHDRFSSDDFMGRFNMPVTRGHNEEKFVTLEGRGRPKEKVRGDIKIKVEFLRS